jgi:hypothetical protein
MKPDPNVLNLFAVAMTIVVLDRLKGSFLVFALLALPSTLFHEASHWLAAVLLNGRPGRLSIWPRREGAHYQLGFVSIANSTWYNAALIFLSPLLLVPLAYWVYMKFLHGHAPVFAWRYCLAIYAVASLLYGSLPSFEDLRLAVVRPIGFALLMLLIGFVMV